ncbi:MAG: toll/interleukin-1 receptor domain-containing protein [Beijerinckiaceae bacterium]|jgi:hypothetical protein|nr:toll/interleukin-1 receptor domain-containing protein [Beijerinckiaceae bacterium]
MVDVFISYKRRLRPRVEVLAESLRALDLDVWYDAGLKPGMSFGEDIADNVRNAKAVVVCWTPDAFPSGGDKNGWVRGEATIGRDRTAMASIMLEPCLLDPPFNMDHVEDFIAWNGEYNTPFRNLVERISSLCGRPGLARYPGPQAPLDERVAWAERFPDDRLAAGILESKKRLDAEAERQALLVAWEAERTRQAQLNRDFEQRLASLGVTSAPPATLPGTAAPIVDTPVRVASNRNVPPLVEPAAMAAPTPRQSRAIPAVLGLALMIAGGGAGWLAAKALDANAISPAARTQIQALEAAKSQAETMASNAKAAQAGAEAEKLAVEKTVGELRTALQRANADRAAAERSLAALRSTAALPAAPPAAPPKPAMTQFKLSEAKFFEEKERADLGDYETRIKTWSLAVEDPSKPSQWSFVGWDNATDDERDTIALQRCQYSARKPCIVYARNGMVLAPADGNPVARSVLVERGRFDENNIPFVRAARRKELSAAYQALQGSRAFAIHRDGTTAIRSGASSEDAQQEALKACNDIAKNRFGETCKLYAVDGDVVLYRRSSTTIN